MGKRLIICLDGTWNCQDDSTNVLHHFSLITEGEVDVDGRKVLQRKQYLRGVGTSQLDYISGGAFGIGLEQNVRDAYNWLVENYDDGDGPKHADEIYLFGFSRGAFTARSLVGFIASCGLLRRGAPLTVKQLWEAYCLIGRKRENHDRMWDWALHEDDAEVRRINRLLKDPWNIKPNEPVSPGQVPGQRIAELKPAERLLVRWSRRVRIKYLGVYDTVGAIGLDALAIPGVASKIAMHHNTRPTTLIQSCRHALAIDEHRSSFNHTPFVEFLGHDVRRNWEQEQAMWQRKIEQRWFIGAHSNIGGGYPNNELAQIPLRWIFDGASDCGLGFDPLSHGPPTNPLCPRDAYAEFVRPLWTCVLRAKRNYRPILPGPELRAGRDGKYGYTLQSINEQLHESVIQHWCEIPDYPPPNLVECAERTLRETANPANADALRAIAKKGSTHRWLQSPVAVMLWATLAAAGVVAADRLIRPDSHPLLPLWLLCVAAAGFTVVDWAECCVNFSMALKGRSPRWQAVRDSLYWVRALGVVLFAAGAGVTLAGLWSTWQEAASAGAFLMAVVHQLGLWAPVAGVSLAVAGLIDLRSPCRSKSTCENWWEEPAISSAMIGGCVLAVALFTLPTEPAAAAEAASPMRGAATGGATLAGLLVLLQIGIAYFFDAMRWVREPLSKAHLGSITTLQRCWTPEQVRQRLETWRNMLACPWRQEGEKKDGEDRGNGLAVRTMRDLVSEVLWRDSVGFIPIYSTVLAFGTWFAASQLEWSWLGAAFAGIPVWLWLAVTAAAADWGENACHLRYLALHAEQKAPPAKLTRAASVLTAVKSLAILVAGGVTGAAVFVGTWQCAQLETGWRGSVAIALTLTPLAAGIAIGIAALRWRRRREETSEDSEPRED